MNDNDIQDCLGKLLMGHVRDPMIKGIRRTVFEAKSNYVPDLVPLLKKLTPEERAVVCNFAIRQVDGCMHRFMDALEAHREEMLQHHFELALTMRSSADEPLQNVAADYIDLRGQYHDFINRHSEFPNSIDIDVEGEFDGIKDKIAMGFLTVVEWVFIAVFGTIALFKRLFGKRL